MKGRIRFKKIINCILVSILLISMSMTVFATQNSSDEEGSQESSSHESGSEQSSSGQKSNNTPIIGNNTSKKLESTKGEINKAEKEKDTLTTGLSDIKKIKERLEKSRTDLKSYVVELDGSLNQIETKLTQLKELISQKEEEIETTKKELVLAKQKEEAQYDGMKARMQFMYEHGNVAYLELLLASKSFGDMLNKASYIEKLTEYDMQVLENYKTVQKEIEKLGKELEEDQMVLKEAKKTAESEQENLTSLITEKQIQIESYESDISDKEKLIQEYEAEIAEQNATIASLEAAVEAEQKRLESLGQNSNVTYDGGMFTWPAPSYTRISSEYGMRMHPTLGVEKFHNGIDMAAPSGTPVLAAHDGVVVGAGYNASMGNYIMINHGNDLYTVYMHCSALFVSSGASVNAGAQIGTIGSTGRSTGPHLHFSVRLNGDYVNPRGYL